MNTETMIRNLEKVAKDHEHDRIFTGQLNISLMCGDVVRKLKELEAELVAERQKYRWIPVEERLPTQQEYLKDDGRFILDDGNRRYQGLFDIYDGKFKFSKHISGLRYELFEDKCVKAWQPLPAPYQPKEGQGT